MKEILYLLDDFLADVMKGVYGTKNRSQLILKIERIKESLTKSSGGKE